MPAPRQRSRSDQQDLELGVREAIGSDDEWPMYGVREAIGSLLYVRYSQRTITSSSVMHRPHVF